MKLVDLQQGTEEWLKWRRLGVGASEAPMVYGVSPHKTSLILWREKTGKAQPEPPHWGMLRGIRLEPKARAWYEARMGIMVTPQCVEHDTIPYLRASLDGLDIFRTTFCEIKCPGWKDHALALAGRVPFPYWVQMQYQMLVTGLRVGHYVSFDGEDGVVLVVEADDAFQLDLLNRVQLFWDCVELNTEPVTAKWDALATNYIELLNEKEAADDALKALSEQLVKQMPNGAITHQGGGLKVTKVSSNQAVNWSKVTEAALGYSLDPEAMAHLLVGLLAKKTITASDIEAGTVNRNGSVRITPERDYVPPVMARAVRRADNPLLTNAANDEVPAPTSQVVGQLDW